MARASDASAGVAVRGVAHADTLTDNPYLARHSEALARAREHEHRGGSPLAEGEHLYETDLQVEVQHSEMVVRQAKPWAWTTELRITSREELNALLATMQREGDKLQTTAEKFADLSNRIGRKVEFGLQWLKAQKQCLHNELDADDPLFFDVPQTCGDRMCRNCHQYFPARPARAEPGNVFLVPNATTGAPTTAAIQACRDNLHDSSLANQHGFEGVLLLRHDHETQFVPWSAVKSVFERLS